MAESTTYFKEFKNALLNQKKYDVHVYLFVAKTHAGFNTKISRRGFEDDGKIGNTAVVESMSDFDKQKNADQRLNYIHPKDLTKSFSSGKKVILLGVAFQFAQPEDYKNFKEGENNGEENNEFHDNAKL